MLPLSDSTVQSSSTGLTPANIGQELKKSSPRAKVNDPSIAKIMPLLAKPSVERQPSQLLGGGSVNPQRTRLDIIGSDDKLSVNVEIKQLIMTPYRYHNEKLVKKKEL